MRIFKAYDIRGIYGDDFDENVAYRVGYLVSKHLQAARVAVSRDMRPSSVGISEAVIRGVVDAGARCFDVGLAGTPMNYFSVVHLETDAGIQVTASHNPAEYNGLKVSRKRAEPVGFDSGLAEIEKLVNESPVSIIPGGTREEANVRKTYSSPPF